MLDISNRLAAANCLLEASGIAEPRREAASLLALALDRDRAFLIAHPEYVLSEGENRRFEEYLGRRSVREPFQYIAGRQEFYGLDFEVTPDVLIPRPETEMVVEAAVEFLSKLDKPLFCEVGVGSGCIAVSILHIVPAARGVGLDISAAALRVAGGNALSHGVAARLKLVESDVFAAIPDESFDLIASNPPYVPAEQYCGLQREVREFEPEIALTDGGDGLAIISRIIREAPGRLTKNGVLLLEIGFDQSEKARRLFACDTWRRVEIRPDPRGIPRLVRAVLK